MSKFLAKLNILLIYQNFSIDFLDKSYQIQQKIPYKRTFIILKRYYPTYSFCKEVHVFQDIHGVEYHDEMGGF